MNTPLLRAIWSLAAGCGAIAVVSAAIRFGGADLARGFLLEWFGALSAAAPLGLVLLPPPARRGARRLCGPFFAGLAVAAAPLLAELGLPMVVSAIACWLAGLVLILAWRRPAPEPLARLSAPLPILWLMLFAAGWWQGGADGPPPVERGFAPREGRPPSGPDVLLISVDTLRADAVGESRPAELELPTFDRLRREGASADFALSCAGLTLPGHLSMLTGLDSLEHGVRGNFDRVPAERLEFLSETFHAAGWRTAAVVSNGLLARDIGFGDGFEAYDDSDVPRLGLVRRVLDRCQARSWLGFALGRNGLRKVLMAGPYRAYRVARPLPERGRGERTNQLALGLLEQLAADPRPYFFFLHYMDPHDPYGTVAPFAGSMTAGLEPLPPNLPVSEGGGISGQAAIALERDLRSDDEERRAAAIAPVAFLHRTYLEEVAFIDDKIGEILDWVDSRDRPTVVLVTSDHGEHFGEHGLMKHGNSLFEELLRVPFFLRGPGVPAGQPIPGQVQLIDVPPTLLALAGLPWAEDLPGRPLVLDGELQVAPGPRQHLAADPERFSLRRGSRKWLGGWLQTAADDLPLEALGFFDLESDPTESRNLLPEVPASWLETIRTELRRDRFDHEAVQDEAQRFRAEELGYADGESED